MVKVMTEPIPSEEMLTRMAALADANHRGNPAAALLSLDRMRSISIRAADLQERVQFEGNRHKYEMRRLQTAIDAMQESCSHELERSEPDDLWCDICGKHLMG